MYVIEHGLHNKKAAKLYAFCLLLACFGVGCLTQANAITDSATGIWNISPSILGIGASVLTGFVIIGGIQSISKVCMKLIPALSLFFVSGCILLMVLNFEYVPESIMLIIKNAFTPTAIGGGIAGGGLQLAARYGVSRGLFTNEAGLGTASVFAAASNSSSPFRQALISMTATFWDTVILCAITGIVIVAHLIKFPVIPEGYRIGGLTAAAFSTIPFGEVMLTLALIGFAIATLIGWSYLGEQAIVYLFGKNMLSSFHLVYICMIFIGAVMSLELVWELTDFFNALLIFPNLYALYKLKKYISFKS